MPSGFARILLLAFMLPTGVQAQSSAGCDNNLASGPGQAKEYDLFKNMAATARGCTSPSPVTYEKTDGQKTDARSGPAPSPQQEELDRTACRSEGESAAKASRGLQPGEYDIFKSFGAAQSGEAEKS